MTLTSKRISLPEDIRTITDPPASHIVNELFGHFELKEIDELFMHVPRMVEQDNFPKFLEKYIFDLGTLPDWVEMERIKSAQQIFWDYGREVILALLCRSLPMCYICANGAEVLKTTARLIDHPGDPKYERRLLETLQFVVNICSDESNLNIAGIGLISVKKVRLIHAVIRKYIYAKYDWDSNKFGEPINQEDMCITICAFSIEVIKALAKMGIRLSEKKRNDWCHLWRVVGYMLGIKEEFLPTDFESFDDLSAQILSSQEHTSTAGRELILSCTEFMESLLPHKTLSAFSYATFKFINDEKHRFVMGLNEKHKFWDWFMPIMMKSTLGIDQKLEHSSGFFRWIIRRLNKWLMKAITRKELKRNRFFFLPRSLQN